MPEVVGLLGLLLESACQMVVLGKLGQGCVCRLALLAGEVLSNGLLPEKSLGCKVDDLLPELVLPSLPMVLERVYALRQLPGPLRHGCCLLCLVTPHSTVLFSVLLSPSLRVPL